MNRSAVAFAAVFGSMVGVTQVATAGVEIGGTAGVHIFRDDNALGTQTNDDTYLASSSVFALRLGIGLGSMFGIELEGGMIPTEASNDFLTFDVYIALARANLIAQFRAADPTNRILPFVTVGGGAMRIVDIGTTDASQLKKETDGFGWVGAGVKYRAGGGWGVRLDARLMLPPSNEGKAVTQEVELLLSLYREFGRKLAPKKEEPKMEKDLDNDGLLGAADQCPNEPEDKDSFEDENGCPDPDNDADQILDKDDQCATDAEDKDSFEDENGCPDPDNDKDGIADASDKCVDKEETKNGFEDEDGCPDEIPAKLAKFTGSIQGINFKVSSADLLPVSYKVLDKALEVLNEFKDVKLEISGHTDDAPLKKNKKFADNDALSQARADSVKAYFVKKGIAEDRLVAKGYGSQKPIEDPAGLKGGKLAKARTKNRRVEFQLIPSEGAGEAPAGDAPKGDAPAGDAPKGDAPKGDAPKGDAPAGDAPKGDAPAGDAPKADEKKGGL